MKYLKIIPYLNRPFQHYHSHLGMQALSSEGHTADISQGGGMPFVQTRPTSPGRPG